MGKQKTFHAETPRTNIVTVRFSDDEMETLDFVCQVLDQSRSQYIRRKALTGGYHARKYALLLTRSEQVQ